MELNLTSVAHLSPHDEMSGVATPPYLDDDVIEKQSHLSPAADHLAVGKREEEKKEEEEEEVVVVKEEEEVVEEAEEKEEEKEEEEEEEEEEDEVVVVVKEEEDVVEEEEEEEKEKVTQGGRDTTVAGMEEKEAFKGRQEEETSLSSSHTDLEDSDLKALPTSCVLPIPQAQLASQVPTISQTPHITQAPHTAQSLVFGAAIQNPPNVSFATLASGQDCTFVTKAGNFQFPQVGKQLFSAQGKTVGEEGAGGHDRDDLEAETDISFQPIVSLPDMVKMKSWDEDANTLFSQRAKLFRFDEMLSEWKERGVGELKIMKHRISGKVQLIMRREQIFKLCCNHALTADMTLKKMATSERAWIWFTSADYSEEVVKQEKLAARFKTVQLADQFKETFNKCRAELEAAIDREGEGEEKEEEVQGGWEEGEREERADESASTSITETLTSMFSDQIETWECQTCCLHNEPSNTTCKSCNAMREGYGEHPSEVTTDSLSDWRGNAGEAEPSFVASGSKEESEGSEEGGGWGRE